MYMRTKFSFTNTFWLGAVSDLDDSFYNAKDKEQADELLKFLESLAPGAVAKARKETERIANLTEEEYAMEFSMETMMGHDEL